MKRIWKFFTSVKLALFLLFTLAATSIIGTIIPQNEPLEVYEKQFPLWLYHLIIGLQLNEMYHSYWFLILMGGLTLNLIICSVDRWPKTWRLIKLPHRSPSDEGFIKSLPFNKRNKVHMDIQEVKSIIEDVLKSKFKKLIMNNKESVKGIYAEKGRWSRLGVYIVHASMLVIFLGAIIGSIFGFKGFVNILEGESVDHVIVRTANSTIEKPLNFRVECKRFVIETWDSGAPKEYRSDLVFWEGKKKALEAVLRVNHPVTFKGITFYQASFGQMPSGKITLTLIDRKTGEKHVMKVEPRGFYRLPDGSGSFRILHFHPHIMQMGPGVHIALERGGEPTFFWIFQKMPSLDERRRGHYIFQLTNWERRYYTGLQVKQDPGVPLILVGFGLMIAGLYIVFFINHKQVWVRLSPLKKGTKIELGANTNKNRLAMEGLVEKIWGEIEKKISDTRSDS